jgi:hypothetical protein
MKKKYFLLTGSPSVMIPWCCPFWRMSLAYQSTTCQAPCLGRSTPKQPPEGWTLLSKHNFKNEMPNVTVTQPKRVPRWLKKLWETRWEVKWGGWMLLWWVPCFIYCYAECYFAECHGTRLLDILVVIELNYISISQLLGCRFLDFIRSKNFLLKNILTKGKLS